MKRYVIMVTWCIIWYYFIGLELRRRRGWKDNVKIYIYNMFTSWLLGTVHIREQKSIGLTQRCTECINSVLGDMNLWNGLGFSLYAVLFVCHIATTSNEWVKSEIGVSADWCVAIEHWELSSIRVYLCQLLD